jgi:glutathionyl-hydroquinone reductase
MDRRDTGLSWTLSPVRLARLPWAHRAIVVRELLGLQDVISMSVVDPIRDERGWAFRDGPGHSVDPVSGFQFLSGLPGHGSQL